MVAGRDRLGALEVGVAGHEHVGMRLGKDGEVADQAGEAVEQRGAMVEQVEAQIERHLLVAAAAGLQLFGGGAGQLFQALEDPGMHVFHGGRGGRGGNAALGAQFGVHLVEGGDQGLGLFGRQDAAAAKAAGMGAGAADFRQRETAVKGVGFGKELEFRRDGFAKASAPEFVGHGWSQRGYAAVGGSHPAGSGCGIRFPMQTRDDAGPTRGPASSLATLLAFRRTGMQPAGYFLLSRSASSRAFILMGRPTRLMKPSASF